MLTIWISNKTFLWTENNEKVQLILSDIGIVGRLSNENNNEIQRNKHKENETKFKYLIFFFSDQIKLSFSFFSEYQKQIKRLQKESKLLGSC